MSKEIKQSTVEKMAERIHKSSGGKVSTDAARKIAIESANRVNREKKGE